MSDPFFDVQPATPPTGSPDGAPAVGPVALVLAGVVAVLLVVVIVLLLTRCCDGGGDLLADAVATLGAAGGAR